MRDPRAAAIHREIERKRPTNYIDLATTINSLCPRTWGWAAHRVYYMGVYQGVRIIMHDGKERAHNIPGKTSVYCIAPIEESDLPRINVDKTGAEIRS